MQHHNIFTKDKYFSPKTLEEAEMARFGECVVSIMEMVIYNNADLLSAASKEKMKLDIGYDYDNKTFTFFTNNGSVPVVIHHDSYISYNQFVFSESDCVKIYELAVKFINDKINNPSVMQNARPIVKQPTTY